MRERMTFKKLLCKIFGHQFKYSHTYNRKNIIGAMDAERIRRKENETLGSRRYWKVEKGE